MEEIYIYNPDSEDFTINFALSHEKPKQYIIKGLQMQKFHPDVAEHIKKHLATKIYEKRGLTNYPVEIQKIYKEIDIDIEEAKRNLILSQKIEEAKQNG